MIFASTSFSGVDLMHVTKAIKILGKCENLSVGQYIKPGALT